MSTLSTVSSVLAAAALGLTACSSRNDASAKDSAAGAVAPGPPATDSAHSAAAPSSIAGGSSMTDVNILAKETDGDSAEVAIGEFARTHASDPQVKAYAALLVRDHSKGRKGMQSLAKKLPLALYHEALTHAVDRSGRGGYRLG